MVVDGVTYLVRPVTARQIDMGYLPQRMYACIGATCRKQGRFLPAIGFDRPVDSILHGPAICLRLPAVEWTTIIFDREFIARHQATSSPGFNGNPRRNSSALVRPLPAR